MKLSHLACLLAINFPLFAVAEDLQAKKLGDFSEYVFAATWQPAHCQSQYENLSRQVCTDCDSNEKRDLPSLPQECNPQAEVAEAKEYAKYLTIHGLWPSLPRNTETAQVKPARWFGEGCGVVPGYKVYKRPGKEACQLPLTLSPAVAQKLVEQMPASATESCLHKYEYAKHGQCFEFVPDDYFQAMIKINTAIQASAFGKYLGSNYRKWVKADDFVNEFYKAFGLADKNIGLIVNCRKAPNGSSYFYEIQFPIKKEMVNADLNKESFVASAQRFKSDGRVACSEFYIDAPGFMPF